ncbi:protocadherin-9-like [Haliotis asinina]|uniref:protocadherin-9-like n=1 Tax=Haliotis asinina TaxID=109174 RepID=UPI003531A1C5
MTMLISALMALVSTTLVSCQNITFEISEGQEAPVLVGNVASGSNLQQQVGETEFRALRYSIVSQESKVDTFFSVDETSGEIFTTDVLDRESFCEHVSVCLLSLDIAAQSSRSAFFRKITVSINVKDINDNPPRFGNSEFRYNLSEGASLGTKISLPLATDKDSNEQNLVQNYKLSPSSLTFALDSVTTDGKISSLSLSLTGDIDRESQDEYAFILTATDGGSPTRTGSLSIIINIIDENDNEPVFQRGIYEATLPESADIDSTVVQVSAVDIDMEENAKISYFFSIPTQERVLKHFSIEESTGLISVKSTLNSEGGSVFDFHVKAVDHGNPQLFAEAQVIVAVTDNVNDPPLIDVKLLFAEDGAAAVPESSTIGRTAALISVKDSDSGRNGLVACQITGQYFQLQKLELTEYRVIVARSLDREGMHVHNVTVTCQDQGTPPLSSYQEFLIRVTDDNDNAPLFSQEKYFKSIDENNAFPVSLGEVKASDKDFGENGEIVYKLDTAASLSFDIDESTGEISAIRTFDREAVPKYTFKVFAIDKGEVPLTGTTTVVVNIGDKNDLSPTFSNVSYVFSVKENSPVGSFVGKVRATDADVGKGGEVQYTLRGSPVNGVIPFTVNAKGEISTAAEIDYESMETYNFDILASDLGTPPQITSVPIKIRILDDNDNHPEINFPVPSNDSITIPHNMEPGTEIAIVQAYDLDSGLNGWLTYSIVTANQTGLFQISASSGVIRLGRAVTDKDVKKYNINISVHDDGTPQRATYAVLNVEIVHADAYTATSSDTNMKIVIVLVCITAVLAIVVLGTLFTIRYVDNRRKYKDYTDSEKNQYSSSKSSSKGSKKEFNELKPGIILVTEGNKLTKKTVTFKNDTKDNKSDVFATEESQYNQLRHLSESSNKSNAASPAKNNKKSRVPSSSTSIEGEVSVVDILHQHKALVQSLRLKKNHNNAKDGEKDPDVWSDTSGETIGTDSGHGGSDLDMNNSLKMSV